MHCSKDRITASAGFALRDAAVGVDGEAELLAVQLAAARLLPPPRARTSVQLLECQLDFRLIFMKNLDFDENVNAFHEKLIKMETRSPGRGRRD